MALLRPRAALIVAVLGGALAVASPWWRSAARAQGVAVQRPREAREYRVKAAYLLNFTRYVDWPAHRFSSPSAPIVLCVYGTDPFGETLDEVVANRSSHGRQIEVRRTDAAAVARECHVVFVTYAQWRRQPELLAALAADGVLTVGETPGFVEAGGVIGFVEEAGTVRFGVNLEARDEARLTISSRMLSLAALVVPGKPASDR